MLRHHLKDPSNSEYLTEIFNIIDADRSGALDKDEFRVFLNFLLASPDGFANQHNHALLKEELSKVASRIDDQTYNEVFDQVDLNKDHKISFDEFRAFLCLTEEEKLFLMGLDAEVLQAVNPMNREEKSDFTKKLKNYDKGLKELELTSLSLMTIPKELLAFTQLQKLDLAFNKFVSWPTDLNAFGQLKELTLTANKISAFADMSGLKSLDTLYLIGNKLTTIGADIFKLTSLTKLDLSNNDIREISPAISLLDELRELNLCGNNIERLPDELGMMEDLNALDLSGNKLKEFPSACCGMKRMMELDLGNNKLTKLPEEFGNMDRLVFVSICDNKIEVLPESLGKCRFIDKFLLDRNPIRDQEMMAKYNLSMDHWKDFMEKKHFLIDQAKKAQAKEDEKNKFNKERSEKKKEREAAREKEAQQAAKKESVKRTEAPRELSAQDKASDAEKEVLKCGLVVKKELAEISRALFKAKDISAVVVIAKAIRDANLVVDEVRPVLPRPGDYPKQTMVPVDPSADQFTRLKQTTTFALLQLDNFFKQLSLRTADLQHCAKTKKINEQIVSILRILQQCSDAVRGSMMKQESKKSLASKSVQKK